MRLSFRHQPPRLDPDELRRRLAQIQAEILDLEQRPEPPPSDPDVVTPNLVVHRLRAPLLQADLVGKRKQYAILSQAAAALGINAGDLERELSNASKDPPLVDPAAERGRWFETVNRLKRLGRVASIAAVPMVLLFVGLTAAPALVGYSGESEPAPGERTGDVAARRIEVSPYIPSSAMDARGATFFTREVDFTFERGRVIVSGEPPPGGAFSVDDGMQMKVTHPDGSVAIWRRDFNRDCAANFPAPAEDVTDLFQPGLNRVLLTLYDTCGGLKGTSSPIWLVSQ